MTETLDESMRDVRRDEALIDMCLERIDFELATEIINLGRLKKPQLGETPLAALNVEEVRAQAHKAVQECRDSGREYGPGHAMYLGYWHARYYHIDGVLEAIDLDLAVIHSWGAIPLKTHIVEVKRYLELMGGGSIDEEGRYVPPQPKAGEA